MKRQGSLTRNMRRRRNSLTLCARPARNARHSGRQRSLPVNETNERLRAAREAVRAMEQQSEAGKSRLKVLEEMKRAHEGYYASVRNVLRDSTRDPELKKRIEGVVAELIRVPKEYETAVEMALGATLQNIVTPAEQDAKYVIEYLRRREYGRRRSFPSPRCARARWTQRSGKSAGWMVSWA